ncbi:MAG: hypothetical protein U0M23_04790 [Acutalibacteraceae bacterium]|nr:hypothetical protein [Acutalibacteraceae bacterium]HIR02524.1 hypothetical protein [Candidatus Scatovicinus merdipullorum]
MQEIYDDLPLGLSMALAKNIEALNRFTSLSDAQKQTIINRTHSVTSKQEMQRLVNGLADGEEEFF